MQDTNVTQVSSRLLSGMQYCSCKETMQTSEYLDIMFAVPRTELLFWMKSQKSGWSLSSSWNLLEPNTQFGSHSLQCLCHDWCSLSIPYCGITSSWSFSSVWCYHHLVWQHLPPSPYCLSSTRSDLAISSLSQYLGLVILNRPCFLHQPSVCVSPSMPCQHLISWCYVLSNLRGFLTEAAHRFCLIW